MEENPVGVWSIIAGNSRIYEIGRSPIFQIGALKLKE
jgi:hypothetical protein